MFELNSTIEETLILNSDSVNEYCNTECKMVYFLDVVDENDNIIYESKFKLNEKYGYTFEDTPSYVINFNMIMDDIANNCIDDLGRIRPSLGIVDAHDNKEESNLEFVPKFRYTITPSNLCSHQYYFDITLPNPAIDYEKHLKFRGLIVGYISEKLKSFGFYG